MQRSLAATVACATLIAAPAAAQTLRGSPSSMDRQHIVAIEHDFTFLERPSDVDRFVKLGLLVPITGGAHFELAGVSYPYARPAVRTFITRLSAQYESACGEPLVVTSLTRPADEQPRNASDESVHPAGMAADLRVSNRSRCRSWLERTLLSLEKNGVLDATRERHPPHYHVAIFPTRYLAYVDQLDTKATSVVAAASQPAPSTRTASGPSADDSDNAAGVNYHVHRGDSLWSIARRYGTSVDEIKAVNGMRGSRIDAGQVIVVPTSGNY